MSVERTSTLLPLLLLTACGSMVGGDYRGEVLLEIEGTVIVESDVDFENPIGVALLWTNDGQEATNTQSVVVKTSFPARYTIQVFREPAEGTRLSLLGIDTLRASIGQIILYEDLDGDGTWAGPGLEPVVGGAYDSAVVWVQNEEDARSELLSQQESVSEPGIVQADAPWESGLDSWLPRGGFQLVEVPIPPSCGLPIDDIFFERTDNRATLHVGGLRNAYYDWDCDGVGEYIDENAPDAMGWGIEECGPPDAIESDCTYLAELLEGFGEPISPLDSVEVVDPYPPFWIDCMMEICPSVVDAFLSHTGPPPPPM